MRNLTQRIAAVLGPTLCAVTSSEALNFGIWKDVHPTLVALNGLVLFAGGMVIVTTHALWKPMSAALVTMSGWLLVLAGAWRLYFPAVPQAQPGIVTYVFIALLGALGLTLCAIAFRRP